eukprot:COSAG06_NODE_60226_length_271_cov_1.191860_1_plen_22_part_01
MVMVSHPALAAQVGIVRILVPC